MAEVLGIVAASLELCKFIDDLRQTVKSVKAAPKELSSLLEEAVRVSRLLKLAGEQQAQVQTFMIERPEWEECRVHCQSTVNDLSSLVAFKKETLKAMRERIESSKSSLQLAQQTFANALHIYHIHQTIDVGAVIRSAQIQSAKQTVTDNVIPQSNSVCQLSYNAQPGLDREEVRRIEHQRRSLRIAKQGLYRPHRVAVPLWFSTRVIEAEARRAAGQWNLKVRVYNVLPNHSEVFDYAYDGNIKGLQTLFAGGLASVSDVSLSGWTPVHFACFKGRLEVVRFLVEQGASLDDRTIGCGRNYDGDRDESCLDLSLAGNSEFRTTDSAAVRCARYLTQNSVCEDLIGEEAYNFFWRTLFLYQANKELCDTLKEVMWPCYNDAPFSKRLSIALKCLRYSGGLEEFWYLLGQTEFEPNCFREASSILARNLPQPLIKQFVINFDYDLGISTWLETDERQAREGQGEEILSRFVLQGGMDALKSEALPCMETLLEGSSPSIAKIEATVNYRLQSWVSKLLEAKVLPADLISYGQCIREALEEGSTEDSLFKSFVCRRSQLCYPLTECYIDVRCTGFAYGASPEEWRLWISLGLDEVAGGFWGSIKADQEEMAGPGDVFECGSIPGAWTEGALCTSTGDDHHWGPYNVHPWDLHFFSRSQRRRRRLLRYLGVSKRQMGDVFDKRAMRNPWCWNENEDYDHYNYDWIVKNNERVQFHKMQRASPPLIAEKGTRNDEVTV